MPHDPKILARMDALPDPDLSDPENPEWTEEDFVRAKGPESLPPEVLAAFKNKGGRPRQEVTKVSVTMRLDPGVVEHFKAQGPGWQSRINEVLRQAVAGKR